MQITLVIKVKNILQQQYQLSDTINYSGFKDKIGNINELFVMIQYFKHLFITAEHCKQPKCPLIRA